MMTSKVTGRVGWNIHYSRWQQDWIDSIQWCMKDGIEEFRYVGVMAFKDTMAYGFKRPYIYCNQCDASYQEHRSIPFRIGVELLVEHKLKNGQVDDVEDPRRDCRDGISVRQVKTQISCCDHNLDVSCENGAIRSTSNNEKDSGNRQRHSNRVQDSIDAVSVALAKFIVAIAIGIGQREESGEKHNRSDLSQRRGQKSGNVVWKFRLSGHCWYGFEQLAIAAVQSGKYRVILSPSCLFALASWMRKAAAGCTMVVLLLACCWKTTRLAKVVSKIQRLEGVKSSVRFSFCDWLTSHEGHSLDLQLRDPNSPERQSGKLGSHTNLSIQNVGVTFLMAKKPSLVDVPTDQTWTRHYLIRILASIKNPNLTSGKDVKVSQ